MLVFPQSQDKMTNPLVSISCITYNHAPYIRQCLDGFLSQKTNFDFEIVIHDDASTDGTSEIILEYAKKHPLIFNPIIQKENQYSKGKRGMFMNFTFPSCRGRYIAMCEGDDFWTDPLKLQKQFDFMEENEDVGLVCTQRSNFNQKAEKLIIPKFDSNLLFEKFDFKDVFTGKIQIATLTVLFRTELYKELAILNQKNPNQLSLLDFCMWTFFSSQLKVARLNANTATYRILETSMSHGDSTVKWNLKKKYFTDFKFYKNHLTNLDKKFFDDSEYDRAKGYYILALKANDFQICQEFVAIFNKNNDYLRYIVLNIVLKFNKLKFLPINLEKFITFLKLKFK